ncbi:hypothetical protein WDL1P1_00289 (plasmid) [Variovorax sp. WDL1]|nr:hypothetical protein CHC06_05869 [Variovorax sp. B2]PNG51119.1 hypothetical protein CHC07_05775 [Variovorax sp. B4]VTV17316.1 hypothetical protein WDL1P1_00289 [Variovorax sp. WDL1]
MKTTKAWVRGEGVVLEMDLATGEARIECGHLGRLTARAKEVRAGARLSVGQRVDFDIVLCGGTASAVDVRVLPEKAGVPPRQAPVYARPSPNVLRPGPLEPGSASRSARSAGPREVPAWPQRSPQPVSAGKGVFSRLPDERTHPNAAGASQVQVPPKARPAAPSMEPKPKTARRQRPDVTETHDRCGHCGKLMVPILVVRKGRAVRSLCRFCGGTHIDFTKSSGAGVAAALLLLGLLAS